jgi:hypothetical protein
MNARRSLIAIPAGAVLLASLAGAPAMADNVLTVGPSATLVAKGVAVDVPVTYTCPIPGSPWGYNYLRVSLKQVARAQQVASAGTEQEPVCDGTPQMLTLRLTVDGGTVPFKAGTALVDATLYTYDDTLPAPVVAQVSQELRITR